MADTNYYVWVEIEANKHRILDEDYFGSLLDRCLETGIGTVILSVKDTTGFGIYKSSFVPHYSLYDMAFGETDYLQLYIDMAHEKGIRLFAGVDVFAEGSRKNPNPLSPGFKNEAWQTQLYAVDREGNTKIRKITGLEDCRTTGSIDDFREVFVNPVHEEVRNYELEIIRELADNYHFDGIVLDRARFIGLGSDFSDYTRERFEKYIGEKVPNWPKDIYIMKCSGESDIKVEYGNLFGKWITFRATIIKEFIKKASEIVKASGKNIIFSDYTGSWYPLYYLVGANWASSEYIPEDYPWVGSEYAGTGYSEQLDLLFSGFYYPDVTRQEAEASGQPAYWYSVEGSGDMVKKVVGNSVPYIGSLFLQQYEGKPEVLKAAVEMCFKKSGGCMLFDLCYIESFNYWDACKRELSASEVL